MTFSSQIPGTTGGCPNRRSSGPAGRGVGIRAGGGLVQAAGVLVFGGLGILVWRALALAGAGASNRPGYSAVANEPARQLVNSRLGSSLAVLALALVLGALVGYAAAGLRTVLSSNPGRVAGGVGWLLGALWTPPVPLAMTVASLAVVGAAGVAGAGRMAILTLALGSAVAVLVAVTVGERWQRRAWLAGGLAGVGAIGRGLAVSTGALLVLEPLVNQPGVGNLVAQSLRNRDVNTVAAAATTLLVVALFGQLVGSLAGAFGDCLDVPEPPATPERSGLRTVLGVAALATLVVPVLALAGSLLTGSTTMFDLEHVGTGRYRWRISSVRTRWAAMCWRACWWVFEVPGWFPLAAS